MDRLSIHVLRNYKRGDLVTFSSPLDPDVTLVKRIVGVENDIVQTLPPHPDSQIRVPHGHIWVEGDEPFRTTDSNTFGPLPIGLIDSKVSMIIWPLDRMGLMDSLPFFPALSKDPRPSRTQEAAQERERWRYSRVYTPY